MHIRVAALLLGLLCVFAPARTADAQSTTTQYVNFLTPPQSTPPYTQHSVRYLLVSNAPTTPKIAAILFAGGNGLLNLDSNGNIGTDLSGNFLVRTREQFALDGVAVAVVDAPDGQPLDGNTRLSALHAEIMSYVIADVRSRMQVKKVWVIGTSTGSMSAISIAEKYPQADINPIATRPDGVVLASAQTRTYNADGSVPNPITTATCGRTVFNATPGLSAIYVPVFTVGNSYDRCPCSPSTDMATILSGLTHSHGKSSKEYKSRANGGGDICSAYMQHGFWAIEQQVVLDITNYMKSRN